MQRQLIISGTILLLLGLLIGTAINSFSSPQIASDAHVAGVQHGMLIILLGLAWSSASLGRAELPAAIAVVAGLYGIWLAFLIGAIRGEAYPAESMLTNTLFVVASWVLIAGVAIFLFGLVKALGDQQLSHQ
jgi:peptidoglycan/LPS O-acetylase OafA/YrhL